MAKDYYAELDKKLKQFESGKEHSIGLLSAICDKITWCWNFRKITEKQMGELADRATYLWENAILK